MYPGWKTWHPPNCHQNYHPPQYLLSTKTKVDTIIYITLGNSTHVNTIQQRQTSNHCAIAQYTLTKQTGVFKPPMNDAQLQASIGIHTLTTAVYSGSGSTWRLFKCTLLLVFTRLSLTLLSLLINPSLNTVTSASSSWHLSAEPDSLILDSSSGVTARMMLTMLFGGGV